MAKQVETTDLVTTTKENAKGLDYFKKSAIAASAPVGTGAIDALRSAGFIEAVTLKVGNPEKGNIPVYLGELIGPGADIELKDNEGTMPTWQCHPVILDSEGKLSVDVKQIHNVIASAQLDAGFKQAAQLAATSGKKVQVGCEWIGKGENRDGQPLNIFRICSRTVG